MGRLPAGVKPTPHKDRLKVYRNALIERGGRRLPPVDLEPEGAKALAAIIERDGLTIKEAVTKALIEFSK